MRSCAVKKYRRASERAALFAKTHKCIFAVRLRRSSLAKNIVASLWIFFVKGKGQGRVRFFRTKFSYLFRLGMQSSPLLLVNFEALSRLMPSCAVKKYRRLKPLDIFWTRAKAFTGARLLTHIFGYLKIKGHFQNLRHLSRCASTPLKKAVIFLICSTEFCMKNLICSDKNLIFCFSLV